MIVIVVWNDAISDEGTFTKDQTDCVTPLEVTSVGVLWIDDDEKIVLARDTFPQDNYRGVITIPRKMVKSVKELRNGDMPEV
jgi:hypothetical protein